MIAADSSTLIALFADDPGPDLDRIKSALTAASVALPSVVLVEMLSDPKLPDRHRVMLMALPELAILPDYWLRAAATRATILERGLRARLADTLIAQSCIDHGVALITRDRDFRHFAKHCGLKLV